MKNLIKSLALVGVLTVIGATSTQATLTVTQNPVCSGSTLSFAAATGLSWYNWWYDAGSGWTLWKSTGSGQYVVTTSAVVASANWGVTGPNGYIDSVYVTMNQKVSNPSSASASVNPTCSGGGTALTLSGGGAGTGGTVKWYTGSCGGTYIGAGNGLTVYPTTTTTYYGRYEDPAPCSDVSSCVSVTVSVKPQPTVGTFSPTAVSVCSGGTTTVTMSGYSPGASIQWYTSPDASNWTPVGDGSASYTTPSLTALTCVAACVTLNMQSQFLSPAKEGDWVEVAPVLTRRTRSLIFLRGILSCAERPLLTFSATIKRVKNRAATDASLGPQ